MNILTLNVFRTFKIERERDSFNPAVEINPADSAERESKSGAPFRDVPGNNVVSSGSPYRGGCRKSSHSKSSYTQTSSSAGSLARPARKDERR